MPSPLEILQKRREAQVAEMEGGEASYTSEDAARDAAVAGKEIRKQKRVKPSRNETKLLFTTHARQRMSQFGLSSGDIYSIVHHGECAHQGAKGEKRMLYQILRKTEVPAHWALRAEELCGTAVVLSYKAGRPRVITVLHYGDKNRT